MALTSTTATATTATNTTTMTTNTTTTTSTTATTTQTAASTNSSIHNVVVVVAVAVVVVGENTPPEIMKISEKTLKNHKSKKKSFPYALEGFFLNRPVFTPKQLTLN